MIGMVIIQKQSGNYVNGTSIAGIFSIYLSHLRDCGGGWGDCG